MFLPKPRPYWVTASPFSGQTLILKPSPPLKKPGFTVLLQILSPLYSLPRSMNPGKCARSKQILKTGDAINTTTSSSLTELRKEIHGRQEGEGLSIIPVNSEN
jgi:hypothetical protein